MLIFVLAFISIDINNYCVERKMEELLQQTPMNVGAKPGKTGIKSKPLLDDTPTLAELGVKEHESKRESR